MKPVNKYQDHFFCRSCFFFLKTLLLLPSLVYSTAPTMYSAAAIASDNRREHERPGRRIVSAVHPPGSNALETF